MKKCIIVKCRKSLGSSDYIFQIGKIYYFSAGVEKNSSIIARDEFAMGRLTYIQLGFIEVYGNKRIQTVGYEFDVVGIKEVPDSFNFSTGEYDIMDIADKDDRVFLERYYSDYEKGLDVRGRDKKVDDIYCKYEESRKIKY